MALYITNNAHTFSVNETQYVWWQAEQYSSTTNKNDIIDDFFYKINELSEWLIKKYNLIAIWTWFDEVDENQYNYSIYEYIPGYTNDNYYKSGKNYGFWIIYTKII